MRKAKTELKPIDKPVYGYFSTLFRSFYSRRLYVDVGTRWTGFGFIYLLLVLAILSIPFFLRTMISMDQSFREQIVEPLAKIPVFYIQNGEILFDKPMPYFIKNKKDQVVVAIDTTGKVNEFTSEYPYLTILITKGQIAFRIPNAHLFNIEPETPTTGKPVVQKFDKHSNLIFDGRKLAEQNSVTGLKYASEIILYPVIVAILFSIFIVFFMVLGFLGQNFTSIFFSFKINFVTSCRLLIVAGTPMLLLLLILLTLDKVFMGSGMILFLLLIAYYSFGIHSIRSENRQVAKI